MDSVNQLLKHPVGVIRMPEGDRVCLYQLVPLLNAIATQAAAETGRSPEQVSLVVLFTSRAGDETRKLVTMTELRAMVDNAPPDLV